jgi:peptide/nickel transport system substrate-binding protein
VTLKAMTQAQAGSVIVGGQGEWTAAILPIGVSLPTQIVSFLSGPTPPNGANFASFDNKDYLAAVQAAQKQLGDQGCAQWAAAEKAVIQHIDLVPFASANTPTVVRGAELDLSEGDIDPASIRMLG